MPFGQGWGQGLVNSTLWDDWSDDDIRKKATILNAPEECKKFAFVTNCSEDAGLYNKKWMPITCSKSHWNDVNSVYTWWGVLRAENSTAANNNKNSFQGDHFADMILLRLADVMLMHPSNTSPPISCRLALSSTFVSEVHPAKTSASYFLMLFGQLISLRLVQWKKAR